MNWVTINMNPKQMFSSGAGEDQRLTDSDLVARQAFEVH